MTDDNQSDAMHLPPTEFDVRGEHGRDGGLGCAILFDTSFSKPIVTADKVRDRIHAASLSIEALMVIESPTLALQRAVQSVHAAYAYVLAHQSVAPQEDAKAALMFRDEEDVALEVAAAAFGSTHGA